MNWVSEVKFTIDDESKAELIIDTLLEERLVACAHRFQPVTSRYWWEGKLETASEWMIAVKTRAELAENVTQRIMELHSYDTPEVLVTAVLGGNPAYLQWVRDETRLAEECEPANPL